MKTRNGHKHPAGQKQAKLSARQTMKCDIATVLRYDKVMTNQTDRAGEMIFEPYATTGTESVKIKI